MITAIMLNGRRLPPAGVVKSGLVYLGSEFCPNLMPTAAGFARARRLFGKPVVLVTPILSDKGLAAAEAVIKKHASRGERLEVVVNDLGLAARARGYGAAVSITAGRVLLRSLSSSPDDFLRRFLAGNGVTRLEADSPALLARWLRLGVGPVSYHMPRAFAAVTRFCPWEKRWVDEKCGFSCLGRCAELAGAGLPAPLLLADCGYCVRNADTLKNCRADRLVYRPEGF